MNIERLKMVRDKIASLPESALNMRTCGREADNECGTAACIGGWTYAVMHPEHPLARNGALLFHSSAWLGLTDDEEQELFYPPSEGGWWATRDQAVRVLDILISEGVVDWNRACREVPGD